MDSISRKLGKMVVTALGVEDLSSSKTSSLPNELSDTFSHCSELISEDSEDENSVSGLGFKLNTRRFQKSPTLEKEKKAESNFKKNERSLYQKLK